MININSIDAGVSTTLISKNTTSNNSDSTQEHPVISPVRRTSFLTELTANLLLGFKPLAIITSSSAITAAALMSPTVVEAKNIPEREDAISKSATKTWQEIKSKLTTNQRVPAKSWNILDSAMHISDNTLIVSVLQIRKEVIETGATNPNIPPGIIHSALYTTAEFANEIPRQLKKNNIQIADLEKKVGKLPEGIEKNKITGEISLLRTDNKAIEAAREKLIQIIPSIIPYVGKEIFDVEKIEKGTSKVVKTRSLIYPSEVEATQKENPTGILYKTFKSDPFNKLGGFVIAQIAGQEGSPETILDLAGERLAKTSDIKSRQALWSIFVNRGENTKLPERVLKLAEEDIFGAEQLKTYKELAAKKAAKTTFSMDLTIPKIPSGKKVGSLEAIPKELHPFPVRPYPFAKAAEEQELDANRALGMLKAGNDKGFFTAMQWFPSKHCTEGKVVQSSSSYSNADYIMLEVIAREASKNDERGKIAFNILGQVMASYPDLVMDAVIGTGQKKTENIPLRHTYVAVLQALNTHPEDSKTLLKSIADGTAKLAWPEPTSQEDIDTTSEIRKIGRINALKIMAFMSNPETFRGAFLRVVNNPFTEESKELYASLSALALSESNTDQTLLTFLDLGLDNTKHPTTRSNALYAFLKAVSCNPAQTKINKTFPTPSPFNTVNGSYYYSDKAKGSELSPFLMQATNRCEDFINQHAKASAYAVKHGGQPISLSETDKLAAIIAFSESEFPNTEVKLCKLVGSNKDYHDTYIPKMIDYLNSCKGTNNFDIHIGTPIIKILAGSRDKRATKVFADIIRNPEVYIKTADGYYGGKVKANQVGHTVALIARTLGDVADLTNPEDEATNVLHIQASKGSSLFKDSSLYGLIRLGQRYEEKINSLPDGEEKNTLKKIRSTHGAKILKHMEVRELGPYSLSKYNSEAIGTERLYAQAYDLLGGRNKMLSHLDREVQKINRKDGAELKMPRAQFIRAYMQALIVNGYNPRIDNAKLGFNGEANNRLTKLYDFVSRQQFSRGPIPPDSKLGEGVEIAILDVGHIVPGILPGVSYPDSSFDTVHPYDFIEMHPTNVASIVRSIVPGSKISSWHVTKTLPELPFRPFWAQDVIPRTLEEIAQNNISGKSNTWGANASFGFDAFLLHDEDRRQNYFGLLAAHLDHLENVGLKTFNLAAGNSHWYYPDDYMNDFYPPIGTLNYIGTHPDGSVAKNLSIVTAADFFPTTPRLTNFSSRGNPLRKESELLADHILSFQGFQSLTQTTSNGKKATTFSNGTSFAAPEKTGIDALLQYLHSKKEMTPLSPEQLRAAYAPFIEAIPHREPMEGGRYPNIPKLSKKLKFE